MADIFDLPFDDESFDHVFVCFVLEHLADPLGALRALRRVLKTGGAITVIEGDHGSTFFHPDSVAARGVVRCQVELQARSGGNANIGRSLYPLLDAAGFVDVSVSPRMVYVDGSRPHLIDGFTRNTFTAMIEGIRTEAIAADLVAPDAFDAGVLGDTQGVDGRRRNRTPCLPDSATCADQRNAAAEQPWGGPEYAPAVTTGHRV